MEMSKLVRIGKISEYKLIVELLNRNFNVYRNICDDDGADLVCEKNNIKKSIEVKSATKYSYDKDARNHAYKRYSFRFGNTGYRADLTIALVPEGFLFIEKNFSKCNSFFWFPSSESKKHKNILNNFLILERLFTYKNSLDDFSVA
jgi:hypothetical protein